MLVPCFPSIRLLINRMRHLCPTFSVSSANALGSLSSDPSLICPDFSMKSTTKQTRCVILSFLILFSFLLVVTFTVCLDYFGVPTFFRYFPAPCCPSLGVLNRTDPLTKDHSLHTLYLFLTACQTHLRISQAQPEVSNTCSSRWTLFVPFDPNVCLGAFGLRK